MVLRVLIAALALTCCDAAPPPVATEPPPREPEAPLLGTETDARSRRERALALRLRDALQALPEVRRATVVVSLPPPGDFDRDLAVPPRALVVLEHSTPAPDLARVRAMVAAGVVGLRAEDVRVELRAVPAPAPISLSRVGPFAAVSALLLRRSLRGAR